MKKQRKVIGIMMSDPDHDFARQTVELMQEELLRLNMNVVNFVTLCKGGMNKSFAQAECSVYEAMNLDMLDGIILCYNTFNMPKQQNEWLQKLKEHFHKPIVSVDGVAPGYDSVRFSESQGMDKLVTHLAQVHGKQRLEFVSVAGERRSEYHETLERLFLDALEKYQLPVTDHSVHYEVDWIEYADTLVQDMLVQEGGVPEAILCISNELAVAMVAALEKVGVHVPTDVIVTGYNEDLGSINQYSVVTTVRRNPRVMAVNAVRTLCNKLEGMEELELLEDEDSCELILGDTCGCTSLSLGGYARKRVERLIDDYSSFDSPYNYMAEELANSTDMFDCLWTLNYYTKFLGDFEAFYLCLNETVMHQKEMVTHLSDNMIVALRNEGSRGSEVSPTRFFNRRLIIPALSAPSEYPRVFYVASVHFVERVFGYAVLTYGNSSRRYEKHFGAWLRKLATALEVQRRMLIFQDAAIETKNRDSVTGLYNYMGCVGALKEQYEQYVDKEIMLRAISLDITHFSELNDEFGREVGNDVLVAMSNILSEASNEQDICARVGNDEFLIAGFYEDDSDVGNFMTEVHKLLREYNVSNEAGVSLDIVYAKEIETIKDPSEITAVLSEASGLKRNIKQKKYDAELAEDDYDEAERREVLRMLDDNLLEYHMQPIVSAKTGDIYSYEALMRSGTERKISPLAIIKHAEAVGRLYDVEKLTFFNVMQKMKEREQMFHTRKLFINSIPKLPLTEKDFDKLVLRYGSLMNNMVVEFTEQTEANKKQIEQIKERSRRVGFRMAIDDYGSGYSNVSNLLTYMPDYVKIDRSLVSGIEDDQKKQYFVTNIIEFAHENGIFALAEGVETRGELNTVIRLGVDLLQGYYLAKPQPRLIDAIDSDVRDEIIALNLKNLEVRQRKVYQVESEAEVMLMTLVMEGYTEIMASHPEMTLVGNPKMQADIVLHVPDNTTCRINLRKVRLTPFKGRPCIEIGNSCNVTLVIDGVVQLEKMGIRVPESSSLTIEGDGKLVVEADGDHSYAIGGDSSQTFGRIAVNMDGEMRLTLDGADCIGIGGGYAGKNLDVQIDKCKNLYVYMTGEMAVGIGTCFSDSRVSISEARVKIEINSQRGIGIGSVSGRSFVTMKQTKFSNVSSGDGQTAIGTLMDNDTKIVIDDCDLQIEQKAKTCAAVGCRYGRADVRICESLFNYRVEGAKVTGIGSETLTGRGHFETTDFYFAIASANGKELGYEPEDMSFLRCTTNW